MTNVQQLAELLKLAKDSPMRQHAASDAYKAHLNAPTTPSPRPMVRDPHAFSQHQQVMQNPGQYMPQGQVSSGLELSTPPRQYKRASELEKLAACLKDNKSWMPAGKKKRDPVGMAGEEGSKTSEVQKLAELLQKRANFQNFAAKGFKQVSGAITNPASLQKGVTKAYDKGGGGFGGALGVAKKYAPGMTAVAAPMAAGALLYGATRSDDQTRHASYNGPEMHKLAGMMGTVGKGLGMAGKVVGALPTGVGNLVGGAMGAVGGAMSAPPGKRLAGAAAGSLSGIPGAAGFIAPSIAGRALGV